MALRGRRWSLCSIMRIGRLSLTALRRRVICRIAVRGRRRILSLSLPLPLSALRRLIGIGRRLLRSVVVLSVLRRLWMSVMSMRGMSAIAHLRCRPRMVMVLCAILRRSVSRIGR